MICLFLWNLLVFASCRYGSIFTVWQYGTPIIMVGSAELIEQVNKLAHNRFVEQHAFRQVSAGGSSIIMGDARDPEWKHLRQVNSNYFIMF